MTAKEADGLKPGTFVYMLNGPYVQNGEVVTTQRDRGGVWVHVKWVDSRGQPRASMKRAKSVYLGHESTGPVGLQHLG